MAHTAIILAAGAGRRLRPLTDHLPKALVEVNGTPILEGTLRHLAAFGVRDALVVTGAHAGAITGRFGDRFAGVRLRYIHNPRFAETNNIVSLDLALRSVAGDLLLLEGDVLFEAAVLRHLLDAPGECVAAVDEFRVGMSGTAVTTADPDALRRDRTGAITRVVLGRDQGAAFDRGAAFKTANLYRFSAEFVRSRLRPHLAAYLAGGATDQYYELALAAVALAGRGEVRAAHLGGLGWAEIDDPADLEAASYRFAGPDRRYETVCRSHGSYQRFGLTDHAYLYNLHFPPESLIDELRGRLRELSENYPVGQGELAEVAARWTFAPAEWHAVGNGAAELIRAVGSLVRTGLVVPVPSYNEFAHAAPPGMVHPVPLDTDTFDLDPERLLAEVRRTGADWAVLVSPNNPTGRAVPRAVVLGLARDLERVGCRLVVDESFIDFCPGAAALSVEEVLAEHPNLVLLKSLTKSCGCLGLRLGYALSADPELVASIRGRLPVFNVNGVAEGFLRLLPRYRPEFAAACSRVRAETDELYATLGRIPWLTCWRPAGNFVFCRVDHPQLDGVGVARRLFLDRRVLVKHCAGKALPDGGRYLRIGSRTAAENAALVRSLAAVGADSVTLPIAPSRAGGERPLSAALKQW
jgi:histidinol-phosphate/aromatic aminotransferase/cobyric acid decarboxylase-like protein/NDP-sugar pyrophosphorylase family protein